MFHLIAFNCHNLFFLSSKWLTKYLCTFFFSCIMGRCTKKRPPCCCCCCCVLAWNVAEIPPSSEGCCSLVKQVILVTKNVYNTSGTDVSHRFSNIYVCQHSNSLRGIYDGCFAEVLPHPNPAPLRRCLVPRVCRVPRPHRDCRFSRDIFIPKHSTFLFLLSLRITFGDVPWIG